MKRPEHGLLAGAVLLALLLRLPALDSGLWYDEISTLVDFGDLSFAALLTTYGSDNNHPLYTILAWLSIHLFGPDAWALRLPAVLFGAAGVGMFHLFASQVAPREEAWIATGLLAVSYHHIWFSQSARGYTALLFFTLAATHFLVQRRWLWYSAAVALATYVHLAGVFVALAHGVLLLILLARRDPEARGLLFGLAGAAFASLLLHAAILPEMIEFLFVKRTHLAVKSEWSSPWWTVRAAALSFGAGLIPGLVVLAGGSAMMSAGTVGWWRRDWRLTICFLLPGIFGAAALVALDRNLWPRSFFFLAGFILLIALRGLALLARKRALFYAGCAVLAVGSFAILPRAYLPKQDFIGAADYAEHVRRPGEPIMTAGLTVLPYRRWLRRDYASIDSPDEIQPGYLLHTLPTYLDSRLPELAAEVARRGVEVKRFPGTLGGGDVVVIRFQANP